VEDVQVKVFVDVKIDIVLLVFWVNFVGGFAWGMCVSLGMVVVGLIEWVWLNGFGLSVFGRFCWTRCFNAFKFAIFSIELICRNN